MDADFILLRNAVYAWCYELELKPVYTSSGRLSHIEDVVWTAGGLSVKYSGPQPEYVAEYAAALDARISAEEAESYW